MKRVFLPMMLLAGATTLMAQEPINNRTNFDTTGFTFDIAEGPVKPNAESIGENYQCPDWFRDVKFGIYMHWGLNSISGFNGHYGRYMYWNEAPESYLEDKAAGENVSFHKTGYRPTGVAKYHQERFGHQSEFGYKDFIPLWKAERFDAEALAKLYKECGAQFIGVMAVHHDNFDLYDSSYQEWNSVNMGPKRDIVEEWRKATRDAGLKFFITSHLSNGGHEHFFFQGNNADEQGKYDYMDPQYNGLYGDRTPDRTERLQPAFAQSWYYRTKELIDKYDPDLLYFDGTIPNGDYGQYLAAHFYNSNLEDGEQTAVMTIKRPIAGFTLDLECKGLNDIQKNPFLVDTSLNPGWFDLGGVSDEPTTGSVGDDGMGALIEQKEGEEDRLRMGASQVVDNLADIVSKNGNMMLNIGLRPDGTIPATFQRELHKIGEWLDVNGEAIYGTRPFRVYGQGDFEINQQQAGSFSDNTYIYTAKDIRYTTTPDALYVIFLEDPTAEGEVILHDITAADTRGVKSIVWLADGKKISWKQQSDGLHLKMPKSVEGEFAFVAKINLK